MGWFHLGDLFFLFCISLLRIHDHEERTTGHKMCLLNNRHQEISITSCSKQTTTRNTVCDKGFFPLCQAMIHNILHLHSVQIDWQLSAVTEYCNLGFILSLVFVHWVSSAFYRCLLKSYFSCSPATACPTGGFFVYLIGTLLH